MTDRLVLASHVRDALVAHAEEGAVQSPPEEICGILAGVRDTDGDGADRVTTVHRVPNVADAPQTRYELDPEATLETIEEIESRGDEVVGFYHSHPNGPAGPSATDRAQATWAGYVYLIVSLADGVDIGAWRWTGDEFTPLTVQVETETDENGR